MIMMKKKLSYLYGPVYSWRLGMSLGIDPLSKKEKICNFDCIYCQLGRTVHLTNERKDYVPTEEIIAEFAGLPEMSLDYITFSGRGEPTLAKNLGGMIAAVRKIRPERIAVITNASLMDVPAVREDLGLADFVLAKLDACSQETMDAVDLAMNGIRFGGIVDGLKAFRKMYTGQLAVQIMFVPQNKHLAARLAKLVRDTNPEEVQLNTPLRPSAVKPLSKEEMDELKKYFRGRKVLSVYDIEQKDARPLDVPGTILRHGNYRKGRSA